VSALPTAIDDVAKERRRQIECEGWTEEHDNSHLPGELAAAGAAYAASASRLLNGDRTAPQCDPPRLWPWNRRWWNTKDPRRDLVRAAALLVAEIERIDRAPK